MKKLFFFRLRKVDTQILCVFLGDEMLCGLKCDYR